jgi:transposase
MRSNLFWLNDEQWARIEPYLPSDVRGKERVDDRRVISGILHVLKSGCRWKDCCVMIYRVRISCLHSSMARSLRR